MRAAIALISLSAALLLGAAPARASCASAVYVDGLVEFGRLARGYDLPPADGRVDAVFPGCNDGGGFEPDTRGSVSRMEGVPPEVGVRDEDTVYLAQGQMTALAGHPLHTAAPRHPRAPKLPGRANSAPAHGRRARPCSHRRGRRAVELDARTRLTNRSVTTPLLTGQRVRATTSRCGRRAVADELTFVGHSPEPERYEPALRKGVGGLPWWGVALIGLGLVVGLGWLLAFGAVTLAQRD